MTRFLLTTLSLILIHTALKAQEIHDLPYTYEVADDEVVEQDFNQLHTFFEGIHAHKKMKPAVTPWPLNLGKENDIFISNDNWPAGTWGLGLFSEAIHFINSTPYWDGYESWYNDQYIDGKYYQGAHPSLWHTGRIVLAYIHAHTYFFPDPVSENPDSVSENYRERIKQGLIYIISVQQADGAFFDYKARVSKESSATREDIAMLETFEVTRALGEGYAFLNSVNDHTMNSQLLQAIEKSGRWINVNKTWIMAQNVNGHAWGVWALMGIYRATGNIEYLLLAEQFINNIIDLQRDDGSWPSPEGSTGGIWHDSFMQYHGVILRGLPEIYAEIYALTYNPVLQAKLKSAINSTINHVISYNQQYGGNKTRLLNIDGAPGYAFLDKYHANYVEADKLLPDTSISTGNFAFDLMTSIAGDSTSTDQLVLYDSEGKTVSIFESNGTRSFNGVTLNGPLFSFMTAGDFDNDDYDEIAFHYTSDDDIVSILNKDLSWSGTMRTCNSSPSTGNSRPCGNNFEMMISLYDANEDRDHIVLYDKDEKLLQIYQHNSNTPLFSENTLNGDPIELMAAGDFDDDGFEEIVFYQPQYDGGRIYIYSHDLTWQATIKPGNSAFNLMTSIDYDGDGIDEIALYDKAALRFSIYQIGFDLPVFSAVTSEAFDLFSSGNFDIDDDDEIAFYSKTTGKISFFDIEEYFPYAATTFLEALVYVKANVDYSSADISKLDQLMGGIITVIDNRIDNGKRDLADQNFLTLALYLNPDFDHFALTHSGSIYTNNIDFDQMAPVNFDHLGRDELAIYDLESKLYEIYESNNHNSLFNQTTPNGAPFSLMTSGDFDSDQKDEIALYMGSDPSGLVSVLNEDLSWRGSITTGNMTFDMITPIDYDNDSFDDIALYDREGRNLKIYKNGINTPVFTGTTVNGPLFDLICSGDFDGDGDEEFAFYYKSDEGLVSIQSKNLTWEGSIHTNNITFDMIARIDYDYDGSRDEIILYDRESKLLNIYRSGFDQPLFSRFTNNGEEVDLMATGNFDADAEEEIALYTNYDGRITILDIQLTSSDQGSGAGKKNNTISSNSIIANESINEDKFSIFDIRRGTTAIQYELSQDTHLEIVVYNMKGNEIGTIVKGHKTSGSHETTVETGRFPSGIYIYRIVTSHSRKFIKVLHQN